MKSLIHQRGRRPEPAYLPEPVRPLSAMQWTWRLLGYLGALLGLCVLLTALSGCGVKRWCQQGGWGAYPAGYYSGETMRRLREGTEYPWGHGRKLWDAVCTE